MPFDDFELSVEDSEPIELYTFVAPSLTRRLTSYHRDVDFGGNTFLATPTSRSNLQIVDVHEDQFDATVEVPASDPMAQHYANGVAPREVSCLIQRYQPAAGVALQMWFGYVESLSFKGRMASWRVPSGVAEALELDCPSVVTSRLCQHILYDARCSKLRTDFDVATTVSAISPDGKTITTVGSVPAAISGVAWALHGELLHGPTSERRTITAQPALNQFTLQCEFGGGVGGVSIGDAVTIFAGCDHSRTQCRVKFANVINFGGHPDLPRTNPFYYGLKAAGLPGE